MSRKNVDFKRSRILIGFVSERRYYVSMGICVDGIDDLYLNLINR